MKRNYVCSVILVCKPFGIYIGSQKINFKKGDALLIDFRQVSLFLNYDKFINITSITEDVVCRYLKITQNPVPSRHKNKLDFIKVTDVFPVFLGDVISDLKNKKDLPHGFKDMMYFTCLSVFSSEINSVSLLVGCINTLTGKVSNLIYGDISRSWRLCDVSNKFYMCESLVKKKLKEEGTCFSQIVMDIKMSAARDMLLSGRLPVKTIAVKCGYKNVSYFIAVFRRYYNMTPRQFNALTSVHTGASATGMQIFTEKKLQ
ncbi:helix-turn-helix domain-containing protein [Salmonella enterica]|nr:helix-turn-helix domain-containing protein [Salmonella enterica]ELX2843778.1 helix-turn-helix domain-containing protein [Salmonella enterica]